MGDSDILVITESGTYQIAPIEKTSAEAAGVKRGVIIDFPDDRDDISVLTLEYWSGLGYNEKMIVEGAEANTNGLFIRDGGNNLIKVNGDNSDNRWTLNAEDAVWNDADSFLTIEIISQTDDMIEFEVVFLDNYNPVC
eukprot:UN28011